MSIMNFMNRCRLVQLAPTTALGTTPVSTDPVELGGNFDSIAVFGVLGTADVGNVVKLQASDDATTWHDLPEAQIAPGGDGSTFLLDVHGPGDGAHARVWIDRAVATTVGEVWAVLYSGREMPVGQLSGVEAALVIDPERDGAGAAPATLIPESIVLPTVAATLAVQDLGAEAPSVDSDVDGDEDEEGRDDDHASDDDLTDVDEE